MNLQKIDTPHQQMRNYAFAHSSIDNRQNWPSFSSLPIFLRDNTKSELGCQQYCDSSSALPNMLMLNHNVLDSDSLFGSMPIKFEEKSESNELFLEQNRFHGQENQDDRRQSTNHRAPRPRDMNVERNQVLSQMIKSSIKNPEKHCSCQVTACKIKMCRCFKQGLLCSSQCQCKDCGNRTKVLIKSQATSFWKVSELFH